MDWLPKTTAELVCFLRASEERRPEDVRILHDPYARHFLSPVFRLALKVADRTPVMDLVVDPLLPGIGTYVIARHRYLDEVLLSSLSDVAQVVILGAGYDARAHRFTEALEDRPLFEVDLPSTGGRKARLLRSVPRPLHPVTRVPIDFERTSLASALEGTGFRPGAPTFWMWEGVSMYLTRTAIQQTLQATAELSGPGSHLAMDFWFMTDRPGIRGSLNRVAPTLLTFLGEPITFGMHPEDLPAFAGARGWSLREVADRHVLSKRYIRDGRRVADALFAAHLTLGATP